MKIKFLKWDKYNKRQKDIRRPLWFAMSNEIFLDPFYSDLSDQERQAFIYLLCEASRQNKYGEVEVSERLFCQITGYKKTVLESTCAKLLKSGVTAGSRQDHGGIATATGQDKTRQDSTSTQNEAEADEGIGFTPNDLVGLWNEQAHPSLARCVKLTDARRRAVATALKEYPEAEFWMDVIGVVNRSPFLLGQGPTTGIRTKPWRCDFDFIIRKDNALKIIEGKYS